LTEFIVPGVLGFAAILGVSGFLIFRRAMATGGPAAGVHPRPVEPARPLADPALGSGEESIVIDPVAMNIVNRVAAGSRQTGVLHCDGGLMVEGTIEGEVHISGGPFVLMPEGVLVGKVVGDGEAYLFGTIRERSENELSELDVAGAVFLTEKLRAKANITAGAIKSYEGAQVEGRIKTMRRITP
jgi:cytoskeletal protein CcmA (bactofilin family)